MASGQWRGRFLTKCSVFDPTSLNTNWPMQYATRTDVLTTGLRIYPNARKMMQQWADYLDELKSTVEVIPTRRQA
jgi:hypothetical protein